MKKVFYGKQDKGITLIALVVTIVILLILAGVTLQMLAGENGVIKQAVDAKEETEIADEKEKIDLAYGKLKFELVNIGSSNTTGFRERISAKDLQDEINNTYGADTVKVTQNGDGSLYVVYQASQRAYRVQNKGDVEQTVNYEEIFKTATKHPDQEDTNDIGIAEDGSAVNLDLWVYVLNPDGTSYCLNSSYYSNFNSGYSNLEIENGKIKGKVPMYIKEDGESDFFPMTNMLQTFSNCTNLTIAPEIPSSVTDMRSTFYECTNLTTAPEIPSSVTKMDSTFMYCTNLTGELIINSNPTDIRYCLYNATTGTDCSLVLKGECPREKLIEIAGTQGLASTPINITIGK